MNLRHAIKTTRNLRRYRKLKGKKTQWFASGPFVPQVLLPQATRTQSRRAHRIMEKDTTKLVRIQQVAVTRIVSFQYHLRFRSLLWNVRNAERMQRVSGHKDPDLAGATLPTLVHLGDGLWCLWNGNHRATANILLGMTHVNARCFKARRSRATR